MDKSIEIWIEVLTETTQWSLLATLLTVCWKFYAEMRFGQSFSAINSLIKILLPVGMANCGWLYLLRYMDAVQPYFTTLAIILGISTVIAVVYSTFHLWQLSKTGEKKNNGRKRKRNNRQ